MFTTTVERDHDIATALSNLSVNFEKRIPDIGNRVSALQVAKLLLTVLAGGYSITAESSGKVLVTKTLYTNANYNDAITIAVLQSSFGNDLLVLENTSNPYAPRSAFKMPNIDDVDLAIVMAIKDFEIQASYAFTSEQVKKFNTEILNLTARLGMLETKLNNAGQFLTGARY